MASTVFQPQPVNRVGQNYDGALVQSILDAHDRELSALSALVTGGSGGGGGVPQTDVSHHSLRDLRSYDDHPQYLYLNGRGGGQVAIGGTGTSDGLTLKATSAAGIKPILTLDSTTPAITLSGVGSSATLYNFSLGTNSGTLTVRSNLSLLATADGSPNFTLSAVGGTASVTLATITAGPTLDLTLLKLIGNDISGNLVTVFQANSAGTPTIDLMSPRPNSEPLHVTARSTTNNGVSITQATSAGTGAGYGLQIQNGAASPMAAITWLGKLFSGFTGLAGAADGISLYQYYAASIGKGLTLARSRAGAAGVWNLDFSAQVAATVTWVMPAANAAGVFTNDGSGNLSWTALAADATTFADNVFDIHDNGDATKKIVFELSGMTAAKTLTITSVTTQSGTLVLPSIPSAAATIHLACYDVAQTWTAVQLYNSDVTGNSPIAIEGDPTAGDVPLMNFNDVHSGFDITLYLPTAGVTAARGIKWPDQGGIVALVLEGCASVSIGNVAAPPTGANTLGYVHLANQGATITTKNLTVGAVTGILYRVSYVLADTTAAAAGTATLTVTWTDRIGSTTNPTPITQALTGTGRTAGSLVCYLASGNLTYDVTLTGVIGSPKFAIDINVEALA